MKQALTAKGQLDVWMRATEAALNNMGVNNVTVDDTIPHISGDHPDLGPINIDYLVPQEGKTRMEIQVEQPDLIKHFKGAVASEYKTLAAILPMQNAKSDPTDQWKRTVEPPETPAPVAGTQLPQDRFADDSEEATRPMMPEEEAEAAAPEETEEGPVTFPEMPMDENQGPSAEEAASGEEPTTVEDTASATAEEPMPELPAHKKKAVPEENTKLCQFCKSPMPAKDKVCPNCHKKQKGHGGIIALIIVGAVIIVGVIGFFVIRPMLSQNSGSSSSGAATTASTTASSSTTASTTASTGTSTTADTTPSASGVKVTDDQYNQIQNGMSYQDVVTLLGGEGTLLSQTNNNDSNGNPVELKIYYWEGQGETGANVSVTFSGGVVTSKTSYGLQ